MIVRKRTKWGLCVFMPNIQFGKIPIFPNYCLAGGAKNARRRWKRYVFYMVVHPSTGHQNPSYLSPSPPIYFHLNFFPYISISIFIFNIYFLYILLLTPYFFVIKKFLSSPIPHNSEKNFFTCQPKSQESSIISHP